MIKEILEVTQNLKGIINKLQESSEGSNRTPNRKAFAKVVRNQIHSASFISALHIFWRAPGVLCDYGTSSEFNLLFVIKTTW